MVKESFVYQESRSIMSKLLLPKNYKSELNLYDTQIAIKTVKDFFQTLLAERLHLLRVSAPLFVAPESGLNDNLNGVERPVTFDIKYQDGREAEIVQSLAKWKRYALKKYGFSVGEGLYTDMSAIRRDEDTDNIHSIYVDQWDWEKIISKEERTLDTLKGQSAQYIRFFARQKNICLSTMITLKKFFPMTFSSSQLRSWRRCSQTTLRRSVNIT